MIAPSVEANLRPLSPDDIVQAVRHLPSAPRVLPKLKHLLTDLNSSIDDIVALIRLDPAIAAQVVRVGNSAYYNCGVPCATVEEAVGRVGFDQIYGLVSYAVAAQVLIRPLTAYGIEADEVWRQSLACAFAAETIAQHIGQDHSAAYTLGLLHGVGMVAIDEWSLRGRHRISLVRDENTDSTSASEMAQLGFTHAEAGAVLLRHWDFPATACAAVRWQDTPGAAGSNSRLTAILTVAKHIRSIVCDATHHPRILDDAVLALLPLPANSLTAIGEEVLLRLEEVSPLLEVTTMASSAGIPDRLRFPNDCGRL